MSLVAERPPKVAVGFHSSAAAEPSRQTISSRSDDRTIATPSAINFIRAAAPRLQSSLRDGRHLDREFLRDCWERGVGLTRAEIRLRIVTRLQRDVQA